MPSYNSAHLIGHLGRDAELKEFQNGSLIKFSLATTEVWKDKAGNKQERTDWHTVEMNGEQGKKILPFLVKGKLVLVEGAIRMEEWEKKGEGKKTATKIRARKIVLLSPGSAKTTGPRAETEPAPEPEAGPFQASDDDIPF